METEKLIKSKRFIVKPFKRVEMYDPWYMENGELSENAKKYVLFMMFQ